MHIFGLCMTVLGDPRLLVETGDRNVYNLSQIPMLQGYNPSQTSTFRHIHCHQHSKFLKHAFRISQLNTILSSFYRYGYGDASLAIYENMVKRPCPNRSSADESGAEFCGSRLTERTHGTNSNINWSHNMFQVDCSSFNEPSTKHKLFSFGGSESLCTQIKMSQDDLHQSTQMQPSAQELMPNTKMTTNQVELNSLKRKASDTDIDLNLSLKLSSRVSADDQGSMVDHEIDSNLSLSLCSQSSSSYLSSRLRKSQDHSKEQGERARTLDLTI